VEINGIDLAIAEHIMPYTKDCKIDYISNAHGQGFAIVPSYGC